MASPYRLYGGATREDAISGLNPAFWQAMQGLYAAAPPDVQRELGLNSAYRSNAVQTELFNKSDRSGKRVAKPGTSKHEKGTAADLFGFGLTKDSVSQATREWVKQNAAAHGLYFPMDYEPWHIQLRGEAAPEQAAGTNVQLQQAQQMKAAGYSPEQIKAAFLSSIASTESPGYDVMYGGSKFTDFSRHPNQAIPIESGPNKGKTSSAAGRYQFIAPTWEEQAKLSGVTDFSAASQDKVAWDYADRLYKAKTGGSLLEALQSQDPGRMNAAAQILSGAWTSLPGGIEQAKGYGGKTFADVFGGYLGEAGTADAAPASPYVLPKPEKKDNAFAKMAQAAMSGLQGGPASRWQQPEAPPQVGAARIDQPAVASIDPQGAEFQRQKLAQILAKLNAGSLVG